MGITKVLVADSNRFFRAGIKQVLSAEPGFEVVECQSPKEVIQLIETEHPSIVLLDTSFFYLDLTLVRKFFSVNSKVRFVMLSSTLDDDELYDMFRIGVSAYIDKNCEIRELITTIKKVDMGKCPINESMLSRFGSKSQLSLLSKNIKTPNVAVKIQKGLTPTDIKILEFVCNGNSYRKTAESLNIAEQTIKNRMIKIMLKLNAKDRTHAAMIALQHGLISFDAIESKK